MPGPNEPDYATADHNRRPYFGPPTATREYDGSLRLPDGTKVDPVAAYHLGYRVEPVPHCQPGEPNWNLHVDLPRPVQGVILWLSTLDDGRQCFLQRFRYTKTGRVPDGPPQPIRFGRTPDNRPIYAYPHQVPPPIREPFPNWELHPAKLEASLRESGVHPDQFKHLDPALVAQEVDPPWVQDYPGFFFAPPSARPAQPKPQPANGPVDPVLPGSVTINCQPQPDTSSAACKADSPSLGRRPGKRKQPPQATEDHAPHRACDPPVRLPDNWQPKTDNAAATTPSAINNPKRTTGSQHLKTDNRQLNTSSPAPPAFTPLQAEILRLVRLGVTVAMATEHIGITRSCWDKWRERNQDFRKASDEARKSHRLDIADGLENADAYARVLIDQCQRDDNQPMHLRIRCGLALLKRKKDAWLPGDLPEPLPEPLIGPGDDPNPDPLGHAPPLPNPDTPLARLYTQGVALPTAAKAQPRMGRWRAAWKRNYAQARVADTATSSAGSGTRCDSPPRT